MQVCALDGTYDGVVVAMHWTMEQQMLAGAHDSWVLAERYRWQGVELSTTMYVNGARCNRETTHASCLL